MLSVSYSDAFLFLKVFSLLGLILIISFSLLITISFNDIKKSEIFWKKAIDFEKLIKDSKTKNVLEGIFKNEFEELKSLFIGSGHDTELYRLKYMLDLKYNLIK